MNEELNSSESTGSSETEVDNSQGEGQVSGEEVAQPSTGVKEVAEEQFFDPNQVP